MQITLKHKLFFKYFVTTMVCVPSVFACGNLFSKKKKSSSSESQSLSAPVADPLSKPENLKLKSYFDLVGTVPSTDYVQHVVAKTIEFSFLQPLEARSFGRCVFGISGMELGAFSQKLSSSEWILSQHSSVAATLDARHKIEDCRCIWDKMRVSFKSSGPQFFWTFAPGT